MKKIEIGDISGKNVIRSEIRYLEWNKYYFKVNLMNLIIKIVSKEEENIIKVNKAKNKIIDKEEIKLLTAWI
jgi:hypothetical protein